MQVVLRELVEQVRPSRRRSPGIQVNEELDGDATVKSNSDKTEKNAKEAAITEPSVDILPQPSARKTNTSHRIRDKTIEAQPIWNAVLSIPITCICLNIISMRSPASHDPSLTSAAIGWTTTDSTKCPRCKVSYRNGLRWVGYVMTRDTHLEMLQR